LSASQDNEINGDSAYKKNKNKLRWLILGGVLIILGMNIFSLTFVYIFGVCMLLWKSRSRTLLAAYIVMLIALIIHLFNVSINQNYSGGTFYLDITYLAVFVTVLALIGLIDTCIEKGMKKYVLLYGLLILLLPVNILSVRLYDLFSSPYLLISILTVILAIVIVFFCWAHVKFTRNYTFPKKSKELPFIRSHHEWIYIYGGVFLAVGTFFLENGLIFGTFCIFGATLIIYASKGDYFIGPAGYYPLVLLSITLALEFHKFIVMLIFLSLALIFYGYDANYVPFEGKGKAVYALNALPVLCAVLLFVLPRGHLFFVSILGALLILVKVSLTFTYVTKWKK